MLQFLENQHLSGLAIGIGTFLIIGLFHPLVIRAEYRWGTRCWWLFLLAGVAATVVSVAVTHVWVSALCGVFAFTSFWAIKELFQQRTRVEKGWFPENPRRKKNG